MQKILDYPVLVHPLLGLTCGQQGGRKTGFPAHRGGSEALHAQNPPSCCRREKQQLGSSHSWVSSCCLNQEATTDLWILLHLQDPVCDVLLPALKVGGKNFPSPEFGPYCPGLERHCLCNWSFWASLIQDLALFLKNFSNSHYPKHRKSSLPWILIPGGRKVVETFMPGEAPFCRPLPAGLETLFKTVPDINHAPLAGWFGFGRKLVVADLIFL